MNYKVLRKGGIAPVTGYQWSRPKGKRPGKWEKAEGEIALCENGIHFCKDERQLLAWLNEEIYEIEIKGEVIEGDDKCVATCGRLIRKLNWNDKTARLFACDCAERVLHIYEKEYPDDNRPRNAIETARLYALGKATEQELDAASDAAWAAWAAWDAAWAAWDAAWYAASAAASAAVRAAWAARDAASAAARDAVSAAASAAARDAVRAAWDAAWGAEQQWQSERLRYYITYIRRNHELQST